MNHRWSVLVIAGVGALIEFAALHLWVRGAYWNFSDGVYAMSAREWLQGLTPYRAWAGAQPPPVFLAGAGLLGIADDVTSLRIGLGVVDLICAALVARCMFLLDGRIWLALATGAVSALLPTTLLNHAQLIPETLAAPLILAGALGCADGRRSRNWLGVLALVLAAWCKVAFLLPALTVTLASRHRWRDSCGVLIGFALAMGASVVIFGTDVWRETVIAQLDLPHPSFAIFSGILAQEAWNDLPLGAGVLLFLVSRRRFTRRLQSPALASTLAGAAIGGLALAFSVDKLGSYGYVLSVAEGPALVLAVCTVAWGWQHSATVLRGVMILASALVAVQTVSVLVDPGHPRLAIRPGAGSGPGWVLGPGQVKAALAAAAHCPTAQPYSGPPELAFLADRSMPGNQPDLFMLQYAAKDARFAQLAAANRPVCP